MVLKIGIISMGSKSSSMIIDESKHFFDEVDHIDIRKIEVKIDSKTEVLYDGEPLKNYDCLYMRGSFRYSSLLYAISEHFKGTCYLPLEANAHVIAHDKFKTHLILSQVSSIKMPATYFTAKISETKSFLKTLNYPIILKFPSGTHGKGVIFAESYSSASSMVDALDVFNQPVLIQDYVHINSDIRVVVAGDKIIGAMRRIAQKGEIRANSHQGGSGEPFLVTPEIKRMSIDAAKQIKADICAVDLIESDYGPQILEINSSPGLQKITEVTKKNIAGEIAHFLFEQTLKFKDLKNKTVSTEINKDVGIEEIGLRDYSTELKMNAGRIILPEFASKQAEFWPSEEVTIKVTKGKIEITKQ
jgi:ribosomal protein S6--L-glutamate ligase